MLRTKPGAMITFTSSIEGSVGVGGVFFDTRSQSKEVCFAFVEDCASHFLEAYMPVLNAAEPWLSRRTEGMATTQEAVMLFNSLRRGTKFGLTNNGRI